MNKDNGARPKVSSSRQNKAKPKAKTSQPKHPENGKIVTKADNDSRSRSKKAQASSEFSAQKPSFEVALPKGYWGPCGKSMSTSKGDLAARPQPSSKPVRPVVLNGHLSNESREMSARSYICDVSDCPEPARSDMTTPKAKMRAQAPARKLVQNSESAEKMSLKVKPPTDAQKTSFEAALPKGYWGPRGKSMSPSTGDLAARPQPSSKPVDRVGLNEHLSNESREMSAKSHIFDVSDYPEPARSGMTTSKAKTRAQAPAKKLVENSESAEKNSIKVKPPTRNGQKCQDYLDKNLGNANKFLLDVFENNVRLKMDDISHNTSILERLKVFLADVKKLDPTFPVYKTLKNLIPTGSYYEKLKVCRPNEFDIMIMLDVEPSVFILEWERSPRMEGYVKLKIPSAMQKSRWSAFMTDDGNYLSPIKIRKHFLELLKKVTKSAGEMKTVKVEEHGPAVQVTFTDKKSGKIDAEADMVLCVEFPNAWPQHAIVEKHGMLPTVLEKLKRKGFHVVPKTFESNDKTWRVSYSECEKHLLLLGKLGCAKNVLKFVKFLREKHERLLPGLNSYHLKNIFLELAFGSKTWLSKLENKDNFMASVINMLSALLDALEKGKLCHFFNSRCNLLLQLPRGDQEKSIETIEWMLTLLRSNDEEQIKKMIPSL